MLGPVRNFLRAFQERPLAETLRLVFLHHPEKGASLGGVVLAAIGFLLIDGLAHAFAVWWHHALHSEAWLTLVYLVGLFFFVLGMHWRLGRAIADEQRAAPPFEPPAPHAGLIAAVSRYNPRGSSCKTLDELGEKLRTCLEARRRDAAAPIGLSGFDLEDELRLAVFRSNWGPLACALELHRPALRRCWLIVSADVRKLDPEGEVVRLLVQAFAHEDVRVSLEEVEDLAHIEGLYPVVLDIFERAAPAAGLERGQVIADLTGGTAPASAAIVLASLPPDRHVEYVSQDPNKSLVVSGETGRPRARSAEEIRAEKILVSVPTTHHAIRRHLNAQEDH